MSNFLIKYNNCLSNDKILTKNTTVARETDLQIKIAKNTQTSLWAIFKTGKKELENKNGKRGMRNL